MELTIWDVFRSIYKRKVLIIIIFIIGIACAYFYVNKNQTYTAEILIKFNDASTEKGLNPKGDKFDVYEIITPSIIESAIGDLNLAVNVEDVRRSVVITPLIPNEINELKKSKVKVGEEYTYNPAQYYVSYTVGSDRSGVYARNMLDAIMQNYDRYYSEKYLNQSNLPDLTDKVNSQQYDYLERAEIFQGKVNSIISYLIDKHSENKEFRSAKTGMNFVDLQGEYNNLMNFEIKSLFSLVFSGRLTKDKEKLIKNYEYKINQLNFNSSKKLEESNTTLNILKEYSKNDTVRTQINNGDSRPNTNNNVIDADKFKTSETTYDKIMNQYVDSGVARYNNQIDANECSKIVQIFQNDNVPLAQKQVMTQKAEALTKRIDTQLKKLLSVTDSTLADYRRFKGSKYISYLSSVNIISNLSLKFYFLISAVIGLGFGMVLAIAIEIIYKSRAVHVRAQDEVV